jgi:hypothetical protein
MRADEWSGVACTGEDSEEALRRWQSLLATRGVVLEQELASSSAATTANGGAAVMAERKQRKEKGGGP